jgi:hypothetical protein
MSRLDPLGPVGATAYDLIRRAKPGRYHIDEISADPLQSGHTSRR